MDINLFFISFFHNRHNFTSPLLLCGDAPVETLFSKGRSRLRRDNFNHVQPTGRRGGIIEFKALRQSKGFPGREQLIKRTGIVGIDTA